MKRIFAAALLSLAVAASASAATTTPPTVYQGDLFVASLTGSCSTHNLGDSFQAIYAPFGLPGNSTTTDQLAIFGVKVGARRVQPTEGGSLNGATSIDALAINIQANVNQNSGITGNTYTITSPILATTSTVNILISAPGFDTNCAATLQGALALRPGKLPN
ncbi:MAG: hypothetical protein ACLPX9_11195 [Rhodomicrobium sp.]